MVAALRFTAALIGAVATLAAAADEYFEGDGTSYTLGQVGSGNCNFMSAIPTASNNYVALNQAQWDSLGNCGRCIEVSCIDDKCTVKNKKAVVQVLDRCPECAHGALDLSPTVYKEITGLDPNRLKVRWRFVDCPNPGTLQVCLKGGSNPNWVAVQPTNSVVGVKSVTVNGGATTMLDGAYYYISTTSNTDLSAVKVAVTSINGEVISGSYSLSAGNCTDTNKQFASSSGGDTSQQQSPATDAPSTATTAPETSTTAPEPATETPAATNATPTTTAPTQTYGSNNGDQSSQSNGSNQYDQSSQATGSTENDASSAATTTAPITSTPESTPATQESTPETPSTQESTPAPQESTPETPASETTNAPTQSGDTTKCKVRTRRQRN